MTPLQQIKQLLIRLAVLYGKELTDEEIQINADFLSSRVTPEELARAMGMYCDNPANEFFPRPISKLVALVKPPPDDESDAREAASRILTAVSKFDRYHSAAPKEYMGELAWAVVQAQGGWYSVCARVDDGGYAYQAQLRDLAYATLKRIRTGRAEQAPALPAGPTANQQKQIENQNRVAQLIASTQRSMEDKKI